MRDVRAAGTLWRCETQYATPLSPEHLRQITAAGPKIGGGADTTALCGRVVAWDTHPATADDVANDRLCPRCATSAADLPEGSRP